MPPESVQPDSTRALRSRTVTGADAPVRRRTRPTLRRGRTVVGTVVAVTLGTMAAAGPALAAGTPTTTTAGSGAATTTTLSPAQAQINAAESKVTAIEGQIANEQQTLDQADEVYNQVVVNLTATRAALASTQSSLKAAKAKVVGLKAHLANDAVQSYIGDTAGQAVAGLFAAPTAGSQTRQLYQQLGAGNVVADVQRVQAAQHQLSDTQAKLLSEQQTETSQLDAENQARQSASAAASLSEATLAQVKGALAQEVAQQAAAQAAAAAAAAAAANSATAKQAAAAQASEAAQVASTVSGGSAAAGSATDAANQAAGEASGPVGVGATPQAAGLAAVHGAMQYLGVPYVWGGASFAGVDCSGLTMRAWAQAGVSLTHSAADQYAESQHVPLSALEPGDLLFYDLDGSGIDHVVMYVGPTLDGQPTAYGVNTIIQAAHTGTVVTFDPLWYYGLVGAGRP